MGRHYMNGLRLKLESLSGLSKGIGCLVVACVAVMTVLAGIGYPPTSILRGDVTSVSVPQMLRATAPSPPNAQLVNVVSSNGTSQTADPAGKGGGVKGNMAQFASIFCNLVSSAQDDPILYPGQPGVAHLHDFFGNATTNAYTTTQSLVDEMNALKQIQPIKPTVVHVILTNHSISRPTGCQLGRTRWAGRNNMDSCQHYKCLLYVWGY